MAVHSMVSVAFVNGLHAHMRAHTPVSTRFVPKSFPSPERRYSRVAPATAHERHSDPLLACALDAQRQLEMGKESGRGSGLGTSMCT